LGKEKKISLYTHTYIRSRRESSPSSYRASQEIKPCDDGEMEEMERFVANI